MATESKLVYTGQPFLPAMKIIVLLFILVILGSLGSALFYLVKDRGQSDRTVKALTVRIAVSVALFILLMAGFYFGLIPAQKS